MLETLEILGQMDIPILEEEDLVIDEEDEEPTADGEAEAEPAREEAAAIAPPSISRPPTTRSACTCVRSVASHC